ncbi:MAG: hypothetical protein ACRCXD_10085 [Luteolibacter sp.]
MKVTKVCCQGCGADLQIDESIRYVTCNYCNARLEVVHDPSVTHTRQLDKIEETTNHLSKKMRVLELQNSIEHIDREWEKFRQSVSARSQDGQLVEPTTENAFVNGIIGFVVGICILAFGFAASQPVFGICIGVIAIGVSYHLMRNMRSKAEVFQLQKHRYKSARKSLLHQLDQAVKP